MFACGRSTQARTVLSPVGLLLGKAIPIQTSTGPSGSSSLRLPRFLDIRHMKMKRFLALRTGRLYPPVDIPGTHFR